MPTVLRVGIVGTGSGERVHVPGFAAHERFDVVAIASPTSAPNVAKRRKIPHAFRSTAEMLAGVELDVLAVTSPPFDHAPSVLAGLERRLHILCEKPFALDVAEAEAMLVASERAGTVCAVAHEFRFTPQRQAIVELIRNRHLGLLRGIEVTQSSSKQRASVERENGWYYDRARGGGIIGANLSHLVDQANWYAGRPPVRVTGFSRTADPKRVDANGPFPTDVADGAYAYLDYGDGLIATTWVDATRAVEGATVAVHGELRTVVATGANQVDLTTFTVDDDETAELELVPQKRANLAAAHRNLPAFVAMLDAFAAAIDGHGYGDLATFRDGLETQKILNFVADGEPIRA